MIAVVHSPPECSLDDICGVYETASLACMELGARERCRHRQLDRSSWCFVCKVHFSLERTLLDILSASGTGQAIYTHSV